LGKSENIFLIGPMGVGKSTIGRQLADKIGRKFIDSDSEIEKKTGASIDLIFEIEGEEGFRKRECKMIEELTGLNQVVLATGGGAILDSDNRNYLKQRGTVIYLKASTEKLVQRTERGSGRPLLQTDDKLGRIQDLLATREPWYEETADLIIHTDDHSVKEIVSDICGKI